MSSKLKASKINQQQQLLQHIEQNSQSQQTQIPSAKNKSTGKYMIKNFTINNKIASLDPHRCTGKFKEDFENICKLKNIKFIPEVILRGRVAWNHQHSENIDHSERQTPQVDKKLQTSSKGSRKAVHATNIEINAENSEKLPITYLIKEPHEFFKPKIGVEMDNPDKMDSVTEIHIKGWKIEKPFMEVFQITFPKVDRLHTIQYKIIE